MGAWTSGTVERLPAQPLEGVPEAQEGYNEDSDDEGMLAMLNEDPDDDNNDLAELPDTNATDADPVALVVQALPAPPGQPPCTRQANPRYFGDQFVNPAEHQQHWQDLASHYDLASSGNLLLQDLGSFLENPKDRQTAYFVTAHQYKLDKERMLEGIQPMALAAKANSEDMPNFYQAMNSNDAEGYYQAMEQEFDLLNDKFQAWEIIPCTEAESRGKDILGTTWVFKRKQYPDGCMCKLKACLCI